MSDYARTRWDLANDLSALQAEAERLRQWKAEATMVLDQWEMVFDALGGPWNLGESKAQSSFQAVERLLRERDNALAANKALIEERDAAVERQAVVDAEVERLRALVERLALPPKMNAYLRDTERERDEARAEVERLRAAIERVRMIEPQPYSRHHAWVFLVRDVVAALDGESDG